MHILLFLFVVLVVYLAYLFGKAIGDTDGYDRGQQEAFKAGKFAGRQELASENAKEAERVKASIVMHPRKKK